MALASYPDPREGFDFASLSFGLSTKETVMAVANCKQGGDWGAFRLEPYGPLQIEPAATVLNYGQSIFEGMKAYRTAAGRIVIFRPELNARRLASGADRFLMPPMPESLFLQIVGEVVRANAAWVPPLDQGVLYLRPVLFGSGSNLGVAPSSEYTFAVFAAPVGSYFGKNARLRVEFGHQRAAAKGTGHVKAAGNYAPCFLPQKQAKEAGFSDIIYTDDDGNIDEAAASNFFCVCKDGVVHTPSLGSCLPGVTRETIIDIVQDLVDAKCTLVRGINVGPLTVPAAGEAVEAWVTGTAAGLAPVEHIEWDSGATDYECPGPVTRRIQKVLRDVQLELAPDRHGWIWDPFAEVAGPSKLSNRKRKSAL